MSEIEMDDLSNRSSEQSENQDSLPQTQTEGAVSAWTLVTAALLSVLATMLSLFPQLLLFLSTDTPSTLTPLERFLATHFGIWLFTIAIALVLNIPSVSPLQLGLTPTDHPLIKPFTFACLFSSCLSYNTRSVGSLASLHCFITGVVGLWGLWVIVFGPSTRISKKTGADKHTSAFIFGNKSAASKQKKEWRKQQRSGHDS